MSDGFEPMLAAQCKDMELLRYPLHCTPKIDGIRCLVIGGVAMSRRMKPIPNRYIQTMLGREELNGLDGELVVPGSFQDVSSAVMSRDGEPDFRYMVFDRWDHHALPYLERVERLMTTLVPEELDSVIIPLDVQEVEDRGELEVYYQLMLHSGHEGIMARVAHGPYKHGRSTFKEQYLIKIKPFEDDEAVVVGFTEQMHNANEAKTDAFGRMERSSHKANKVGKGTLGTLVLRHPKFGDFEVGTGFDDTARQLIWDFQRKYLGETVKFRYQAIGVKDKPRIPVFLGFRDKIDL